MGWIILIILIGTPLLELSLLIDVGGQLGGFNTVALCIMTAFVGLSLVRAQGMGVMKRMQDAMAAGEPFGHELIHGFFLLFAGLLLMFPGFITDSLGGLLLIPFVRSAIGKFGIAQVIIGKRGTFKNEGSHTYRYNNEETTVIDIEGEEVKEATPDYQVISSKDGKNNTDIP
ncbi:FxsA family protein [Temperatibacter marinus]|uniref:FxsA family protein n=1 Tax=Temperatibacter marinus TaxID=1456591 RepID=A0AA52EKI8_9PROT|nr:FxsA family protein [Temperatibacter marinus]WND03701.1 FxsA family protein [Temperatibacter marinus]